MIFYKIYKTTATVFDAELSPTLLTAAKKKWIPAPRFREDKLRRNDKV